MFFLFSFDFIYLELIFLLLIVGMLGVLMYEFRGLREKITERMGINNETNRLKLQALERLTVYAERSGLKNLIGRLESMQMSASSLHATLVETLKSEYEYNVSQQIYVSPEVWNAVTRLKDQNIYIINQIAATLPAGAGAIDLSKRILEYSMNKDAELNVIVLDALQYEARKIID
jgi:hypothetical protein